MAPEKKAFADETFEIEKILSHKPEKKKVPTGYLRYKVKWAGYTDTSNSEEDSWQFEALGKVLAYWKRLSDKKEDPLHLEIQSWLRLLNEWQKEMFSLRSDDFFSICQLSAWISKYECTWQIQEFKVSEDYANMGELFNSYEYQLKAVAMFYDNAPYIEVENTRDKCLPIPWKQLLFGIEEKIEQVPAKDTIDPFGLVLSLGGLAKEMKVHRERLRKAGLLIQEKKVKQEKSEEKPTTGGRRGRKEKKAEVVYQGPFPPSKTSLKLLRSRELVWELHHQHDGVIKKGQIIMPLTGELVDVSVADECIRQEGEFMAMSGFIRISEDLCLDRRYRSGFDRFLHHNCDPNCCVEVVWKNGKPIAMIKARKAIISQDILTLDFFTGFKVSDSVDASELFKKRTTHVKCCCNSSKCRNYLWVDEQAMNAMNRKKKAPKANRLLKRKEPFHGLAVAKIEPRPLEEPKKEMKTESED